MLFRLEFNTDNAAFDDDATVEIIAVLQRVAAQLERTDTLKSPVLDTNGNRIGEWRFVE